LIYLRTSDNRSSTSLPRKSYQHRLKSLSGKKKDTSTERQDSINVCHTSGDSGYGAASSTSSSGAVSRLSPAAARTAGSVLSSSASTASSQLATPQTTSSTANLAAIHVGSNNLLCAPKSNVLLIRQESLNPPNQQTSPHMLRSMQKKYSKSIDCTHYLTNAEDR
jgi:hypothetical protein